MLEMFRDAVNKAGSDDPTKVAFALEGMTGKGAHGEVYMRPDDHQNHFDMVISHISTDVERPFIYNDENYGMAYVTDAWISKEDLTLPTTCNMARPSR